MVEILYFQVQVIILCRKSRGGDVPSNSSGAGIQGELLVSTATVDAMTPRVAGPSVGTVFSI